MNFKINNIELFHINQFLNEKKKNVFVHTINNIKTVLSGMFKWPKIYDS